MTALLDVLRDDFGIVVEDLDSDGLPEEAALALYWAVGCGVSQDNLAIATRNAYDLNRASLWVEDPRILMHRDVLAALFGISTALRDALAAVFAADGVSLLGEYASVSCDDAGFCTPSALDKTWYEVFAKQSDGIIEPYTGSADFDGDGISNADEYAQTIGNGGTLADFVAAAQNPGTAEGEGEGEGEKSPPSCHAASDNTPAGRGELVMLCLLILLLSSATLRRAKGT